MLLKINNVLVLLAIAIFQIANCHNAAFDSHLTTPPLVVPENNFVCWSPLVKQLAHNWNTEFIDQFTLLALKQKDVKWLQWLGLDESQAHQLFMKIQEIPVFVPTLTQPPIPPASLTTHSVVVEHPVVFQPPQTLYTWFNTNGERQLIQELQFPASETGSTTTNVNKASWNIAGNGANPNLQVDQNGAFKPESSQGSSSHFNYNFDSNLKPQMNFNRGFSYNIASKSDNQPSTGFTFNSGSKLNAPTQYSQFGFNSKQESVDPKINHNSNFKSNPELNLNTKPLDTQSGKNLNIQFGSKLNTPTQYSQFGFNSKQESVDPKINYNSNFKSNPELNLNTKPLDTQSGKNLNIQFGSKLTDPKLNFGHNLQSSLNSKPSVFSQSNSQLNIDSNLGSSLNDNTGISSSDSSLNMENLDVSESTIVFETTTDLSKSVSDRLNVQVDPQMNFADSKKISVNSQFDSSKNSNIDFGLSGSGSLKNLNDAREHLKSEHGLSKDLNVNLDSSASSDTTGLNIKLDSESAKSNAKQFLNSEMKTSSNGNAAINNGFGLNLNANSDFQSDNNAELKNSMKIICTTMSANGASIEAETVQNAEGSGDNGAKSLTGSIQIEHEKQGHSNGLGVLHNLANKVKSKIGELSFASNRSLNWSSNHKESPKSEVKIDVKKDGSENAEINSNAKFGADIEKNLKIETGSSGLKFSSSRNFDLGKKSENGNSGVQSSSGFQFQIPSFFAAKNKTESIDESKGSDSGFGFNRKFSMSFGRN